MSPDAKGQLQTSAVLHGGRFDRDLSDLAYIERILAQAWRLDVPVGERLRFLAIVTRVLDEFLAVRLPKTAAVALQRVHQGVEQLRHQQLKALEAATAALREIGFHLDPGLGAVPAGASAKTLFSSQVMPLLTPFAVDEEHPFPHLDHGDCAFVITPAAARRGAGDSGYVIVPLPKSFRQDRGGIVDVDGVHLPIEALLRAHAQTLLGEPIESMGLFRVYRENDLNLGQDFGDLRTAVEDGLYLRPRNPVVAIETETGVPAAALDFLRSRLTQERDPFVFSSPLPGGGALDALIEVLEAQAQQRRPSELFFESRFPRCNPRWENHDNPFAAISAADVLLHWPYEQFDPLLAFLRAAARDPDVVAIRQTLYRTNETIVQPLIDAARRGAEVTVVFELEARENERANVELSHRLQAAGAHVVYGVIGLKVHAKLLLVTRREEAGLVSYANISTGNYHPGNARHYTDLCLFTADAAISSDLLAVFNYITGHLRAPVLERLIIAPHGLREHILGRIEREVEHARAGRPAAIWLKLNSLLDGSVCKALRAAADAGVEVHAVVRRHCALLPESDDDALRVTSLIGRLLEHPRIVCFANGGPMEGDQAEIHLSSADWMPRNFDERVEVLLPVSDPALRQFLVNEVMRANLDDEAQSWMLTAAGHYRPVTGIGEGFCAQTYFAEPASEVLAPE